MPYPAAHAHPFHRKVLGQALLLGSLGVVALTLPLVARAALQFPRTGVVCDSSQRICYDANGASVAQTRATYGTWAARNVERQLVGQPPRGEIVFSGGELCDLRRRTCWVDGSGRTNVNTNLSNQLFGASGGTWGQGGTGWNSSSPAANSRNATCQLSQRGRMIFNGDCALRQRASTNGTAYVVELPNGRRYPFFNRQGQLVLRDSSGTWPAQSTIRGNDVAFRWSDLQLITRPSEPLASHLNPYPNNQYPNNPYPNNQYPYPNNPSPFSNSTPTGAFLQNLFNNLFR